MGFGRRVKQKKNAGKFFRSVAKFSGIGESEEGIQLARADG